MADRSGEVFSIGGGVDSAGCDFIVSVGTRCTSGDWLFACGLLSDAEILRDGCDDRSPTSDEVATPPANTPIAAATSVT
jgi:hypothetical protein